MRMWMIDPKLLCRKHLLGEHGELHKFIPSFKKKIKVHGRISPKVQIEPKSYEKRHNQLVKEMLRRGYSHNSKLKAPDFSYLPKEHRNAKVNINISIGDLKKRCKECKKRIEKWKK
ncbi:hypothetical protein JXB27_01705 [Candidatus Woesearchaeota archaeon]|nr:hypothetical protein [Candidatus Woesearchaeota archaeon]